MKYDCKNCEHSKHGATYDEDQNKHCKKCTVDSKDIFGKPTHFREIKKD